MNRIALAVFLSVVIHTGLMAMPMDYRQRAKALPRTVPLSIRLAEVQPRPLTALKDLPAPPATLPAAPPKSASPPSRPLRRPSSARPATPPKPVASPEATVPNAAPSDPMSALAPAETDIGNPAAQAAASGKGDPSDSSAVTWPRYHKNPSPPYPSMARRRGHQGTVVLDVFVKENGKAGELRIAASSGYPMLDRSALNAVRFWRFDPGRENEAVVAMWVKVPIRFSLQ